MQINVNNYIELGVLILLLIESKKEFYYCVFLALFISFTANAWASASTEIYSQSSIREFIKQRVFTIGPCSGVYISNTGYFIANLHCAQRYLSFKNNVSGNPKYPVMDMKNFDTIAMSKVVWSYNSTASWNIPPRGNPEKYFSPGGTNPSTTVLLGSGYMETRTMHDDESLQSLDDIQRQYINKYLQDFIIIKVNELEDPVPCFSIEGEFVDGQRVIGAGFPMVYGRSPGLRREIEFTEGVIASKPVELIKLGFLDGVPVENEVFDWTNLAVTSFKTKVGMSGGPIINTKGNLVGIQFASVNGVTYLIRISHIKQLVISKLGEEKYSELFSCIH